MGIPGAHWSAKMAELANSRFSEKPCPENKMGGHLRKTPNANLWLPRTCAHTVNTKITTKKETENLGLD